MRINYVPTRAVEAPARSLAFMEGKDNLVEVSIEDKDANYLRMQLNQRIKARGLEGVQVSAVNNVCYLEKE